MYKRVKHVALTSAIKTKEVVTTHTNTLIRTFGLWGTVALALGIAYVVYTLIPESRQKYETITVSSGGTSAVVSVPGTIVPVSDVTLTFEGSGRVASVNVAVGDRVGAGDVLAAISQSDISAQIANSRALRDAAEARLNEIKTGASAEDIAVTESQRDAAKVQLSQASSALADTLNDAFQKADDAIRVKTDVLFSNPRTATPQLAIQSDTSAKIAVENERLALETVLNNLSTRMFANPASTDVDEVKSIAIRVRNYLDKLSLIVNDLSPNASLAQANIDAYKANITAARTSISAYITGINTSQTAFASAQTGLKTAESQLALKKSGATESQIAAQEAQVRAAVANISNLQALAAKRVIYAPFAGTVTKVDVKRGEVVGAGSGGISLISASRLQVESYIPEVYISKVSVKDPAVVILDAYGSEVPFDAIVTSIDPSATVKEGITSYKTTLKLVADDSRTKPGMSGDVTIKPTKKDTLITIPSKSIVTRDGKSYIQIPSGDRIIEREIVIGLMNDAGVAEVTSGISDGDVILLNAIK